MKFFSKNIFNVFYTFLILINFFAFLAPIAAHFEMHWLADPIYAAYSIFCHQFHWRSLHIHDHQLAWCTRDTFIWLGLLSVATAVKFGYIKNGLTWFWLIPFTIPIAMDGGIQTIATMIGYGANEQFYLSTNFMRMITGSIFGIGIASIIMPVLKEESDKVLKEIITN